MIRIILLTVFFIRAFLLCHITHAQMPGQFILPPADIFLESKQLTPILEQLQRGLSSREILILVVSASKDTAATDLFVSSIMSTAQVEENVPSFIAKFHGSPVLVYLRNVPVQVSPEWWIKTQEELKNKLARHTLAQFRLGINYSPEVWQLTLRHDTIVRQRKSIAITLPGWRY